jgi:hypothetical protein
MRFLCFFCVLSLLLGSVTRAQRGNPTPEEFTGKLRNAQDNQAKVDANNFLRVYPLKYTSASLAMTTLQTLGPACQIAADSRQNAIVINANKDDHAKISELLQLIDVPEKEGNITSIVRTNSKEVGASGPMVSRFADMLGVNIAIDQETGVFMIKGPKNEVQRVTEIIDEISAASREKIANDAKTSSRSYALRVLWLSNEPLLANTVPTLNDAKLESSIQRLSALGFANMTVRMQLLGRCDLIAGKAQCKVDGSHVEGDMHRTFDLQANFSGGELEPVNGKLVILAGIYNANSKNMPPPSKVEVALNLRPEKYYILSAGPIGGFQSAFVVQLIEDL